jgi:ribosomal protein S18 acetylase RimI-like enzyme
MFRRLKVYKDYILIVGMKIQKATIKNLKEIQELCQKLVKKEHKEYDKFLNLDWTFGKQGTEYFKGVLTKKDSCVFIAIIDNKIVGYLVGRIIKGERYRILPKIADLDSMFIMKKYQRLGVGSKLYNSLVKWCKSKKVKMIKVEASAQNEQGIRFYKKNGFKAYALTLEVKI